MKKITTIIVVAAALVTGCSKTPRIEDPTQAARKNLVWVVVDTLRADRIGCYGASISTPRIDSIASEGVRFERAYSHIPTTGPSHASMFTGLLPFDHKVEGNAQVLDDELTTLAEILQARGYSTAGVVSLGVLQSRFGFAQGFSTYDDEFDKQWFRPADEITDSAIRLLDGFSDEPSFLFVHYSDPHEPYSPPGITYPEFRVVVNGTPVRTVAASGLGVVVPVELEKGKNVVEFIPEQTEPAMRLQFRQLGIKGPKVTCTLAAGWGQGRGSAPEGLSVAQLPAAIDVQNKTGSKGVFDLRFFAYEILSIEESQKRYDLEVEFVDREIGRLIDELKTRGLWDRSVVVFTSDHGEGLGDHGLLGHISQVYDSLLRVPMIIVAPGVFSAGTESNTPVGHVDLVPTILDVLAIEAGGNGRGRSLKEVVNSGNGGAPARQVLMTFKPEAPTDLRGIATGDFKLIRNLETGAVELYDLKSDPAESDNLIGLIENLDEEMASGQLSDLSESTESELSEEEREQLRILGYIR